MLSQFLNEQSRLRLTYAERGASRDGQAPRGHVVDHNRQQLGRGAEAFAVAREAIRAWKMFPRWTAVEAPHVSGGRAVPDDDMAPRHWKGRIYVAGAGMPSELSSSTGKPQIEVGHALAVLVNALGVWWLNAARIVYVIDEPRRFGFAYGTLPGHAESGEERFSVEHLDDDTVWYDVFAFSKPRYWGARLAYPLTRMLQKRFARDSKRVMQLAMR